MKQDVTEKLIISLGLAVILVEMSKLNYAFWNNIFLFWISEIGALGIVGYFWYKWTFPIKERKKIEGLKKFAESNMEKFHDVYVYLKRKCETTLEAIRKTLALRWIIKYSCVLIGIISLLSMFKNTRIFDEHGGRCLTLSAISFVVYVLTDLNLKKRLPKYISRYREMAGNELVNGINEGLSLRLITREDMTFVESFSCDEFAMLKPDIVKPEFKITGELDKENLLEMVKFKMYVQDTENNKSNLSFDGIYGQIHAHQKLESAIRIYSVGVPSRTDLPGGRNIKLDNKKFMDNFVVKCKDKMQAVRFLTSEVMEMMIKYKEEYGVVFDIILNEDNVYFLIHDIEMFKPLVLTSSVNKEMLSYEYLKTKLVLDLINKINNAIEETV